MVKFEELYEFSDRAKRISIDIDGRFDWLKILQVYFTLKHLFPNSHATVQKTKKGYHIQIVGEEIRSVPIEKRVKLRDILGDDWERIDYEYLKLELGLSCFVDTLFELKIYKGVATAVEDVNPIAYPYVSKIPAKKSTRTRVIGT